MPEYNSVTCCPAFVFWLFGGPLRENTGSAGRQAYSVVNNRLDFHRVLPQHVLSDSEQHGLDKKEGGRQERLFPISGG